MVEIRVNKRYIVQEGDEFDPRGMLSVSQCTSFLKCTKEWAYKYEDGLVPRVERPYLTVGRLCHIGFENAMRLKWKHDSDPKSEPAKFGECMDWGIFAMENQHSEYLASHSFLEDELPMQRQILNDAVRVFATAWQNFNPDQYEVVTLRVGRSRVPFIEVHFCVPCPPLRGFHGYIDAMLMERATGHLVCVDYKFRRSLASDAEEAMNLQNYAYIAALNAMGIENVHTMTWQHLNTPPAIPTRNQNGSMSRAKIKTDWDTYSFALREAGLDPADYYDDMMPKLAEIEWFRDTREFRGTLAIANVWQHIVQRTANAVKEKSKRIIPAMFPWNCRMCAYSELCQAELRGYDVDFIRNTQFVSRETPAPTEDPDIELPGMGEMNPERS